MTTFSQQEAELLHKLASNTLSPFEGLSLLIFFIPFISSEWKFHTYLFLTSLKLPIGSTGHLSNTTLTLIFILVPFISVALIFFSILILRSLIPILPDALQKLIPKRLRPQDNKVFLELTFPSDTSKSAYATEQLYTLIHALSRKNQGFFSQTRTYALEIVSTKENGIRYILVVPSADLQMMHRSLLSYLPGLKVKEIPDYLTQINLFPNDSSTQKNEESETEAATKICSVIELKLSEDFALPLQNQKVLDEHDPISFLTGNMTKLKKGEFIAFQVITTPSLSVKIKRRMQIVRNTIYQGKPLSQVLSKKSIPFPPLLIFVLSPLICLVGFLLRLAVHLPHLVLDPNGPNAKAYFNSTQKVPLQELLNPYEQELSTVVKEKLNQHLFETSIRLFIVTQDQDEFDTRETSLVSSFEQFSSPYQSLTTRGVSRIPFVALHSMKKRWENLTTRKLSKNTVVLSSSELSDLFHFPYTSTTKTEGMVQLHSTELAAPLSLRQERDFDVVFGRNTYGGEETAIGLTEKEREKHMALFGGTGNGKSTLYHSMIAQDMKQGKGVCVIDPHGDLSQWILACVPENRKKDVIYFNPDDIEFPIGLNLLETTPGLSATEVVKERQFLTESVISLFRRVFADDAGQGHAHRIEHILRNTIQTSFEVPNGTLLTIYDLLEDQEFRNTVIKRVTDERLKKFWQNEFKKAGDYQRIKMISPVTARIGKFMFSPFAKRIIEQEKSTINFDEIMDEGKIVICNLSRGKLGEDTSEVLGMMIMNKIQLAALKRARVAEKIRRPFYLYIDEFQYFATKSFVDMVASLRKFHVYIHIAEQSTAQNVDPALSDILLSNVGVVGTFRTASAQDEDLILPQFAPYVKKGEIYNLPQYHFYMKISSVTPEEPFSGETIPLELPDDPKKLDEIIALSRKQYAREYKDKNEDLSTNGKIHSEIKPSVRVVKKTNGMAAKPEIIRKQRPDTARVSVDIP